MPTLTEAQAAQALALTTAYKAAENKAAAKVAALVALYYRQRVVVDDPNSVQAWLDLVIPQIIRRSDAGAKAASEYFAALRRIEVPGAERFEARAARGMVDTGVSKSLMAVGPGDYMNKARDIKALQGTPTWEKAMLAEAKQTTSVKLVGATLRHAQAGSRQTLFDASQEDRIALGWVRVTGTEPCFFCAMLASRGLHYRAFTEGAFDMSDARFTGDGDAKVHDNCGCSLKPVYAETGDPVLQRNETFVDMWERWGAGGGDAALRFRRGYNHYRKTNQYLSWDDANVDLRAA